MLRPCVCLVFVCLLSACASQSPPPSAQISLCEFVVASEVDGVSMTAPDGAKKVSEAGQNQAFRLPCQPQSFRFEKECYPSRQVTLQPKAEQPYRIERDSWLRFGYLRVENDSGSEPLVIGDLSGQPLEVTAHSHAARRVPLGNHEVTISAPYKVPAKHEFRLCAEDDIFNLRVATDDGDGKIVAQGSQAVTLEHGTGQLRIVTEIPNVTFRLTPDRSATVRDYLEKLGLENLADVDVDQAPESLREALALIHQLDSKSFMAPAAIELPAGLYRIKHSAQPEGSDWLKVQVLPGKEAHVNLL